MRITHLLLLGSLATFMNAQFIKEGNIVKDTKTNFLWQDNKEAKTLKMGWKEGQAYCKKLEIDGVKGWEMPGFGALFSIVDTKMYNPTLDKAFKYFEPKDYWSTKVFSHGVSNEAFVVEFKGGAFNRKKMDTKFNVRCYKKAQ